MPPATLEDELNITIQANTVVHALAVATTDHSKCEGIVQAVSATYRPPINDDMSPKRLALDLEMLRIVANAKSTLEDAAAHRPQR